MMAAIFAGMALIPSAAGVIAEDIERKSLRFLILAGVKPQHYLLGTGGFLLLAGTVASCTFAVIGDFTAMQMLRFLVVMIIGTAGSIILGMAIGMLSKNQQAGTALCMPVAMILGFTPMIASFNNTVEKIASILYTQQLNVVINDVNAGMAKPVMVMFANIAVFLFLFILSYKMKGLRS